MAHYVRVSQNTPGKVKTVLRYVSGKYRSAKHRVEAIKSTLKAKYDLLRNKVSCGIKKSATGGISKKEHYARNQYNTDLPQSIRKVKKQGGIPEFQQTRISLHQKISQMLNMYHRMEKAIW